MTKITAEEARRVLTYVPETGDLIWKERLGKKKLVGKIAGAVGGGKNNRRRFVGIHGVRYPEHRIIWLIVYGDWPAHHVDHINGDSTDNRLCNLRDATHSQNQANRKRRRNTASGHKGVSWHQQTGKWRASVIKDGKRHSAGLHDTPELAAKAYLSKATELFGKFATDRI